MIDERTERLIYRRLDGQLTEAESLELDKLLIRSPEARAKMEQYQRTDALAAESLRAAFAGTPSPGNRAEEVARASLPRRGLRRAWGGMAVAAAIVLAVLAGTMPRGWLMRSTAVPDRDEPGITANESAAMADAAPIEDRTAEAISEGPRRQQQRILRDVLGVFDPETQSLYLLEMDRAQTTVVPVSMNY